jgi:hypothetical protein
MAWHIERFDPFLGWVAFAQCATRMQAINRRARTQTALPTARLRITNRRPS